MLSQLHGSLQGMLVAITALVVAAHRTGTSQFCHHSPRRIAEIEIGSKILGKNRSLAQSLIGIKTEVSRTEGIIITHKFWSEHLLQIQIDTPVRIGEIIPVIINQRYARSYIPDMLIHPLQQFRSFYLLAYHIVVSCHRSHIEVIGYPEQEAGFCLSLPTLHITLVVIVIAHLVTDSPEIGREGIEIEMIIDAITTGRSYMIAPNTQHIEAHRTDITEKRYIGRWQDAIVRIGAVKSCRHHSQTKLGIGSIVRTSDYTEVESLMPLVLVSIIEVVKESCHPRFLDLLGSIHLLRREGI